jgi:hypothetical protein
VYSSSDGEVVSLRAVAVGVGSVRGSRREVSLVQACKYPLQNAPSAAYAVTITTSI